MASSSSQLSGPPSSPPRTPPMEHRSLKRRPFRDPEATPRAARRSRSVSSSPAARFSDVERRPALSDSPFGPMMSNIAQHFLEERKISKGKGKAGATPLTHNQGVQAYHEGGGSNQIARQQGDGAPRFAAGRTTRTWRRPWRASPAWLSQPSTGTSSSRSCLSKF